MRLAGVNPVANRASYIFHGNFRFQKRDDWPKLQNICGEEVLRVIRENTISEDNQQYLQMMEEMKRKFRPILCTWKRLYEPDTLDDLFTRFRDVTIS